MGSELLTERARQRLVSITTDQYRRMWQAGIIPEGAPIELVDGLLVCKDRAARGAALRTIGPLHVLVINRLAALNSRLLPLNFHLRTQAPVELPPYGAPEPDGAIVLSQDSEYSMRHPVGAQVPVVIEAADSSLEYDRSTKLASYARSGISQYLIVNLPDLRVEVYEEPIPTEARYAKTFICVPGQPVVFKLGGGKTLVVDARELLP